MLTIFRKLLKRLAPKKYASKIGINLNDVHIYGNVDFGTEPWIISFGKNVHLTDGVKFITHDGATLLFRDKVPTLEITGPISVGDNVYIGNNALILPNVNIGNYCIVAAGAVVTKNVPDFSVVAGVPAKVIESSNEYFEKACKKSLKLGNLKGKEKDDALKLYFEYKGNSKGIYF